MESSNQFVGFEGFELVTTDPFSPCELGGVWVWDYICGEVMLLLLKYCIYCVSAPSLHKESTDSLITIHSHTRNLGLWWFVSSCWYQNINFYMVKHKISALLSTSSSVVDVLCLSSLRMRCSALVSCCSKHLGRKRRKKEKIKLHPKWKDILKYK